tara:strand:- start:17878 stop:18105 length:228 start_codon:yes stop_codon:yes gene_type:complete
MTLCSIEDLKKYTDLVDFALKIQEQNRQCSKRYYDKVKDTAEYKEKRARWNKEQYAKIKNKKLALKNINEMLNSV